MDSLPLNHQGSLNACLGAPTWLLIIQVMMQFQVPQPGVPRLLFQALSLTDLCSDTHLVVCPQDCPLFPQTNQGRGHPHPLPAPSPFFFSSDSVFPSDLSWMLSASRLPSPINNNACGSILLSSGSPPSEGWMALGLAAGSESDRKRCVTSWSWKGQLRFYAHSPHSGPRWLALSF